MKRMLSATKRLLPFFLSLFFFNDSIAQDCILKDTLLKIDFGTAANPQEFNLKKLSGYRRVTDACPNDGMYAFLSSTAGCYSYHWHELKQDHTPGDDNGRVLLVNASYDKGLFFYANLGGLKPGKKYEFSTWLMNVCQIDNECTSTLPDITISLETPDGKMVARFNTGEIPQTTSGVWKRYFSTFTAPENIDIITLKLFTNSPGGCGNDFALDDITFRECYPPPPPVTVHPEPVKVIPPMVVVKPVAKEIPKEKEPLRKTNVTVNALPTKDIGQQPSQIKNIPVKIILPEPIRNRENPVVKKIESVSGELLIELYDNGTIDGDTVSIYLNNELIVSRAGLSEKPITIKVKVNKDSPHQELTMVAENLGSIPPNTSLMIVTSKGKREEVFISSTKQKNARLVIDLKE